ncbi:helix-turn-helix domain-containing protein [Nocardia cyriacigeorgica]|uniref:helix-turn-helix domain-containing protein n=1 Tax=Nocardia cyriacigeorgica TaxID=135487 RepID=UPI0018931C27|nr:helix-turn-helix transcriptional regulator [Nocardia cyriacigeorgica]
MAIMVEVITWTGGAVRLLRKAARMPQTRLAECVGVDQRTVSAWECSPDAEVSPRAADGLDKALANMGRDVQNRFHTLLEDHDMLNRRQFAIGTALGLGAAALPTATSSGVTPTAVEHLRTTVHSAMLLDDQLGSAAAKPIITAQAQTCLMLLRECPSELRSDVQGLAGEAIGSLAWAAWDEGRYAESDKLFMEAFGHAVAAHSLDVAVGMMCHRIQLAIWTHRYQDAASLSDATMSLPATDARMIDYRYLQVSQAYAYAGRSREAWQVIERISGEHPDPTTPDVSYAYYMSDWLTGLLSSKALEMAGESRAAVETIESTIDRIPDTDTRDKALAHLHLAKLTAPSDIERACAAATQALDLARVNTSPRLRAVYHETRALLEPWAKTVAVRELDRAAETVIV